MDSRLLQAAERGDTHELSALLEADPLALQRVALLPYAETPLHIATLAGKTSFVKVILQHMPNFAWDLNKDGFTPLHIASATGNIDILREILKVSPDLCLIKDKSGRTPLHYAAIKGRVDVVNELLHSCPQAAREVTAKGETALYLAVSNNQFGVFKALFDNTLEEDLELINVVTDHGNTISQLAESNKHDQVLNLLKEHGISITNMDHITEEHEEQIQDIKNQAISISIVNHNNQHNKEIACVTSLPPVSEQVDDHLSSIREQETNNLWRLLISKGVVPILAAILATSAYKEGISPPQILWNSSMKQDLSCFLSQFHHLSLTQSKNQCPPGAYYLFMASNATAFYCALSLIFLHHVPGFLHVLLPATLLSSLMSYWVVLLTMFPDAPTFLLINSAAILVVAFILILRASLKRILKCINRMFVRKRGVKWIKMFGNFDS